MINEQTNSIISIKKDFEDYKNKEVERKIEIKKDLLVEIAPKADIKELNGKIDTFHKELNGKIDTIHIELNGKIDTIHKELNGKIDVLESKLIGEFKSIRLWMKTLAGLAVLAITSFSPTAQALIKLIKF